MVTLCWFWNREVDKTNGTLFPLFFASFVSHSAAFHVGSFPRPSWICGVFLFLCSRDVKDRFHYSTKCDISNSQIFLYIQKSEQWILSDSEISFNNWLCYVHSRCSTSAIRDLYGKTRQQITRSWLPWLQNPESSSSGACFFRVSSHWIASMQAIPAQALGVSQWIMSSTSCPKCTMLTGFKFFRKAFILLWAAGAWTKRINLAGNHRWSNSPGGGADYQR